MVVLSVGVQVSPLLFLKFLQTRRIMICTLGTFGCFNLFSATNLDPSIEHTIRLSVEGPSPNRNMTLDPIGANAVFSLINFTCVIMLQLLFFKLLRLYHSYTVLNGSTSTNATASSSSKSPASTSSNSPAISSSNPPSNNAPATYATKNLPLALFILVLFSGIWKSF